MPRESREPTPKGYPYDQLVKKTPGRLTGYCILTQIILINVVIQTMSLGD